MATESDARAAGAKYLRWFVLPVAAVALFIADCAIFHHSLLLAGDLAQLVLLTLPGVLLLRTLNHRGYLPLAAREIVAFGLAMGFGISALTLQVLRVAGLPNAVAVLTGILVAISLLALLLDTRRVPRWSTVLRQANAVFGIALFVLLFCAAYNLRGLHYTAHGDLVTRGLFGVDLPFLAGEIHGLREYGMLRDLHQLAQPWHYHEATYHLLSVLPSDNTMSDLAFIAPLFGYTLLSYTLYCLVRRLGGSEISGAAAIGALFLVGSFTASEQGSYALSPSFVFGSMLLFATVAVLDHYHRSERRTSSLLLSLFLLLTLSQTKLSTFLVLVAAIVCLCIVMLIRRRTGVWPLLCGTVAIFLFVVIQSATVNPLMPGGDFLIGAPLLGYANHVAALLHIPLASINPVTHGSTLSVRSLLIIPFFVFHFLRFALLDPRILTLIAVFFLARSAFRSLDSAPETGTLLALMIPLGYLLPVLYSPAWYPLALSFYAPLVSVQAALVLAVSTVRICVRERTTRRQRVLLLLLTLIWCAGFAQNMRLVGAEMKTPQSRVTAGFQRGMDVLAHELPDTTVVASRRYDWLITDTVNDESFYWYSALSQHPVVSEGAKYGSLLAAEADTDSAKGLHPVEAAERLLAAHRSLLNDIYQSNDPMIVRAALTKLHARFFLVDHALRQKLGIDPLQIGERTYADTSIEVWKVHDSVVAGSVPGGSNPPR